MTKYAENYSETEENFGKKILCCRKYKREVYPHATHVQHTINV